MKIYKVILLIAATGIMSGCKKETMPVAETASANLADHAVKDTVYLVKQMVTNHLVGPSPVTQTETFTYNANRKLIKHDVDYKSASSKFTVTYSLTYSGNRVTEVVKKGTKHYPWTKVTYTYPGYNVKMVYTYPSSEDILMVALSKDLLPKKVQGSNGFYYLLDYDGNRNITQRSEYENANPSKPYKKIVYTYDNKCSPFWALRDNPYIVAQAFNDMNTHNNNRLTNDVSELYNHTYNSAGYPTQTVVVASSVARKKITYTYTKVVVN